MKNMNNKQKATAIAAIGAAAVFGMLSFGNNAQAAKHSYSCQTLNAVLGLSCCDRMIGSRLIDTNSDCHEFKKISHKRRLRRPNDPPIVVLTPILFGLDREWVEGSKGNGGGDGGSNKDKGPNSLQ